MIARLPSIRSLTCGLTPTQATLVILTGACLSLLGAIVLAWWFRKGRSPVAHACSEKTP